MRYIILATALAIGIASAATAAEWPQFMGPNRDGTSAEKGLLKSWPEGGPKVLWQTDTGLGYAGAAISGGKVYFMDRAGTEKDVLRCLDMATGKQEWTFEYEASGTLSHDGSRSTPAVGEKYIYIVGGFGQLHCIDKATHKAVWSKHLLKDYGTKIPMWGVTQSALLYKGAVIVAPQSANVGVAAFDQATGNKLWESPTIGPMDYCSPAIHTIAGIDQVLIVNRLGVHAVAADGGKLLWQYEHPCKIPVPNVTALGDGRFFVTGGYMAGSAIIKVAKQGEEWKVAELGKDDRIGGHCHPAMLSKDHLYILCNTNERQDGMVCFSLDSKMVWQTKRDPYLCKGGSILTADGILYQMDGATGELHVVQPSPEGFKSLAKAKLLDGKEVWGPLALSDGRLIIRSQREMKCVDLRP